MRTLAAFGLASLKEARNSGAAKFLAKPYTAIAIQSAIEDIGIKALEAIKEAFSLGCCYKEEYRTRFRHSRDIYQRMAGGS